jgi:hypothetical protein
MLTIQDLEALKNLLGNPGKDDKKDKHQSIDLCLACPECCAKLDRYMKVKFDLEPESGAPETLSNLDMLGLELDDVDDDD